MLNYILGPMILKLLQLSQNSTGLLLLSDGTTLNVPSSRVLYDNLLTE